MPWRMAKSLDTLLAQINALSPNRDKSSDGGIGNAEHASRSSDHNPWVMDRGVGVVTARDFTHDPAHGIDSEVLANVLRASKDHRIKYIISNKKIASGSEGPQPWAWRKYTGANPHNHHCHVSVSSEKPKYDSTAPWSLTGIDVLPEHVIAPVIASRPVLRRGSNGKIVKDLQALLHIPANGVFDAATEKALRAYQEKNKLVADGVAGAYTWKSLEGAKT